MPQDIRKPDSGRIGMPKEDSAMNRIAPTMPDWYPDGSDKLDAGKTKSARDEAKVLERIRKRFAAAISAEAEQRKEALDDVKFTVGISQWPDKFVAVREASDPPRPCLVINKCPTFVNQVINSIRENRPSIHISPVGDKSDKETARFYRGWIRSVERDSHADLAYDTAAQYAITSGVGYFRIGTKYTSDKSFDQTATIDRISNPFTVYLDPAHSEPDGSDARWAIVSELIAKDEFEELYPDAATTSYTEVGVGDAFRQWVKGDFIRVAEYFEYEHEEKTLVTLSTGWTGYREDLDDRVKSLIASGEVRETDRRDVRVPKVKWCKVTAIEILEENDWPGYCIPIIKVVGQEWNIEGKTKTFGLIRFAKDPQRMYNYFRSKETETIALAPATPWILEEGQVMGHENEWVDINARPRPFVTYKGTNIGGTPAPPPQRVASSGIPEGIVTAAQNAAQDMMATTGVRFDATLSERMQDESGRAIRELRRSGDIGQYHYADNLARSMRHAGRILVDLCDKLLNSRRIVTILREDDSDETVLVDPSMNRGSTDAKHPHTGKNIKAVNPKYGDFAVTVTIGPSYATKRIEAAEAMMSFAAALPQQAGLIADLIAESQDWDGAEKMAARLARALPPELLEPVQADISPQVQAYVESLKKQLQAMIAEKQQLVQALNEKRTIHALEKDKIDKDFAAKIAAVVQKEQAAQQKEIGSRLEQLAEGVDLLMQAVRNPPMNGAGDTSPVGTAGRPSQLGQSGE